MNKIQKVFHGKPRQVEKRLRNLAAQQAQRLKRKPRGSESSGVWGTTEGKELLQQVNAMWAHTSPLMFSREEISKSDANDNKRQLARYGRVMSEKEPGTLPREWQRAEQGKVRKTGYLLLRGVCKTDLETAVNLYMAKGDK